MGSWLSYLKIEDEIIWRIEQEERPDWE